MANDKARIFVGGVPGDVRESEMEDAFRKYGPIHRIDLKKGFAFVMFDSERDAADAARGEDGRPFLRTDRIMRVEMSKPREERSAARPITDDRRYDDRRHDDRRYDERRYDDRRDRRSRSRSRERYPRDDRRDRYDDRRDRYDDRDRRRDEPMRRSRTNFRIVVRGLPPGANWQDLKDFGRKIAPVNFANVKRDDSGAYIGVIEYTLRADMDAALAALEGKDLLGSIVHVEEEDAPAASSAPSSAAAVQAPVAAASQSDAVEAQPHHVEETTAAAER